ncbi:hypothetical protein ACFV2Z_20315 [Streptomyces sp. NPDC059688]|uniref:hypothetical protein n=1 Tax=Streptomyces sp. NPDC059688 TaxID=3346906 RepID=UPI0036CBDC4D
MSSGSIRRPTSGRVPRAATAPTPSAAQARTGDRRDLAGRDGEMSPVHGPPTAVVEVDPDGGDGV